MLRFTGRSLFRRHINTPSIISSIAIRQQLSYSSLGNIQRQIHRNNNPFSTLLTKKPIQPATTTPFLNLIRHVSKQRHKKMVKLAKGYRGRANRCFKIAKHRVLKARQYAYRDRKVKKRTMRSLWIVRINAGSRMYGVPYRHLVNYMKNSRIILDRKILSTLAVTEPLSFRSVVEVAKQVALAGKATK